MNNGTTLASNERLKRLDAMAMSALSRREFDSAEELLTERLNMLSQYRYVDDLDLAMTLNNLAFSQECQSKIEIAQNSRRKAAEICAQHLVAKPRVNVELPKKAQRVLPAHRQQARVSRSA